MAQAGPPQGILQARIVGGRAHARIGHGHAQGAQGQIGPLRQEQRLLPIGPHHATLRIRPQPRDRAQQRGLATARRSLDQQGLASRHVQAQVLQQDAAVRPLHGQALDAQARFGRHGFHGRQRARLRIGIQESLQAVERGAVRGEGVVRGTEERQRILHLPEGLRGLHHVAQLDRAGEEARRLQQERKHHRDLADRQVETVEFQATVDNGPQVGDVGGKARPQRAALCALALVERHVLGVLAQAHQGIPEIGGQAFAEKAQFDQRPADTKGHQRRDDDVQVHHEHHRTRDFETADVQRTGQIPQDQGEFHQRHHGAQGPDGQRTRTQHELADVLLDTLVGIVGGRLRELVAVVGPAVEPIAGQPLVEPGTPVDVEHLADVAVDQAAAHVYRGQHREDAQVGPEPAAVQRLQRAVEAVVPEGEQHRQAYARQGQQQQQGQRQQGPPVAPRRQIGPGQAPELPPPARGSHQHRGDGHRGDGRDEKSPQQPPQAVAQLRMPIQIHGAGSELLLLIRWRGTQ